MRERNNSYDIKDVPLNISTYAPKTSQQDSLNGLRHTSRYAKSRVNCTNKKISTSERHITRLERSHTRRNHAQQPHEKSALGVTIRGRWQANTHGQRKNVNTKPCTPKQHVSGLAHTPKPRTATACKVSARSDYPQPLASKYTWAPQKCKIQNRARPNNTSAVSHKKIPSRTRTQQPAELAKIMLHTRTAMRNCTFNKQQVRCAHALSSLIEQGNKTTEALGKYRQ
jgi:hypothetical protein